MLPVAIRFANVEFGIESGHKHDTDPMQPLPLLAIQPLIEIGKVRLAEVLVFVAPGLVRRRRHVL